MSRKLGFGMPTTTRALAWVYGPVLLILTTAALLRGLGLVSIELLFRDPVQTADLPFYAGVVSHLGIIVWAATASVALFAGSLLIKLRARREAMLPLAGGTFTLALVADDLFVLHERAFPELLGVAETTVFGVYVVVMMALLWWFRGEWKHTELTLLVGALAWFALSLVLDLVPSRQGEKVRYLAEDGAKLLGIMHWCAFFVRTSQQRLTEALRGSPLAEARGPTPTLPPPQSRPHPMRR